MVRQESTPGAQGRLGVTSIMFECFSYARSWLYFYKHHLTHSTHHPSGVDAVIILLQMCPLRLREVRLVSQGVYYIEGPRLRARRTCLQSP